MVALLSSTFFAFLGRHAINTSSGRWMCSTANQGFTLRTPVEAPAIEIKKSKFIGRAWPCETLQGALERVEESKTRLDPKARHWCWAWRGAPGKSDARSSDDGEPSSTAGKPIFSSLESENLFSTVVIVTRYFGGIELGTGGLVRAYGQAARDCLELAIKDPIKSFTSLRMQFSSHEDASKSLALLLRVSGGKKLKEVYRDDGTVEIDFELLESDVGHLTAQIIDLTKGRAVVSTLPPSPMET